MDSVTLDGLDRQLLHALQLDGRAPFSRVAEVLGTADRTVARRYRRLRAAGAARVLGLPDVRRTGHREWFVRVRCLPDAAPALADALARRPDTSWVTVLAGGAELSVLVRDPDRALLEGLGRTPHVLSVQPCEMLRPFMDEGRAWPGRTSALTAEQVAALRRRRGGTGGRVVLNELDARLLPALAVDGRAAYPELARAAGRSESAVRRRLAELRLAGALQFTVETDPRLFGYAASYMLWLTVAPGRAAAVAGALAGDTEIAFIGAVTGPAALVAYLVCRDADDAFRYLDGRVGALDGVRGQEAVPVTAYAKKVGSVPARRPARAPR
ncbi:AsnC family transcriptional regulator [Actinomadura fibrosa]|uniref:AsnC family transcriptional regulator n=1 Tax=Actinomadura fibrosa TaxID=111802 RepID=A0ABW2XMA7_9ACTN|nr:AsnC family transcriptional regulator [Actinomadura fibrosa]